jgi:hypothetical protein
VLELVEEAFDEVAMSIEFRVDRALDLAVAAGRDVGSPTGRLDEVEDGPGIIAAVADERSPPPGMPSIRAGTAALSEACPGRSTIRMGSPRPSTRALILVLSPPRERPMA